jgi:drug/metabolite transporter (DMT)-like permease
MAEQQAPGVSPAAAWSAFAACCLIWGSTFLFISIGNDTVPALWAASLRLALAAVILMAIVRLTGQHLPRGEALRAAAWYGFLNLGVNMGLLYWGEKSISSGLTAVLYATVPLSTAVFSAAFGIERFTRTRLVGACIALAGVAVIFSHQLRSALPLGPFVALIVAPTVASLGAVMLKRGPRQSALGVNAVGCVAGLLVCLPMSFVLGESHRLPSSKAEWIPIVYLTLAGSVGAFVLFSWLLTRWTISRISFIPVIVPLVALLLGALVRHEPLTLASLLGAALVVSGVVLGLGVAKRPLAAPPAASPIRAP